MSKKRVLITSALVVMAIIASLTPSASAFASSGKSTTLRVCQNDGWTFWREGNGTAFRNQGGCVSYVVRGGTLTSPYPAAQSLCESFGGTFRHDDQLGAYPTRPYLWTCNDLPPDLPFPSGNDQLAEQCFADGGTLFVYNPNLQASTCFLS